MRKVRDFVNYFQKGFNAAFIDLYLYIGITNNLFCEIDLEKMFVCLFFTIASEKKGNC